MKLPLPESKILEQVQSEYQLSYNTVVRKRQQFRDQEKYLTDTSDKDKLDLRTLYYIVQTMLALYYTDEIIVDFKPRRFGSEVQTKNLRSLAKFDYKEMRMNVVDYEVQYNRLVR